MRKIHQAATGPPGCSTFDAASEAADTIDLTGFEGWPNDSRSTAVTGLPSGPDATESINVHGHIGTSGCTSVGELFAGANNLTGMDGFTPVNGLLNVNDVNEFAEIEEVTTADGFTNVGGLPSIEGFIGVDEVTGMDRFASMNDVTGVAVPDVFDYNTVDTVTSYDAFGWFACDYMFIQ